MLTLELFHLSPRPNFEIVILLKPIVVWILWVAYEFFRTAHAEILVRIGGRRRKCVASSRHRQNAQLLGTSNHRLPQVSELRQIKLASKVVFMRLLNRHTLILAHAWSEWLWHRTSERGNRWYKVLGVCRNLQLICICEGVVNNCATWWEAILALWRGPLWKSVHRFRINFFRI